MRVRRVSSQATTSASRSAASTRSVMSSRLPIGVGQTTSRPALTPALRRVHRRAPAARRRASPPPRRTARARSGPRLALGGSARAATTARAGPSSSSPRRDRARRRSPRPRGRARSRAREPDAEPPPDPASTAARRLVAVVGQLGDERAGDLAAARQRAARAPSRASLRAAARPSRAIARPRRQRLEAAAAGAVARAVLGPVEVDHACGRARRRARARRGRAARRARSPPPIPVPSVSITASLGVRAPPRAAARRARRRSRRCRRRPAAPSRSLIRSRNGTSSSGRWFDQARRPSRGRPARGCRSRPPRRRAPPRGPPRPPRP